MLVCKECGYTGKQIHQHLKAKHGLTGEQYREKYGKNEILQEGFIPPALKKVDSRLSKKTKNSRKKEQEAKNQERNPEITLEEVQNILTQDRKYLTYLGKGNQRKLFKENPELYKAIYFYTQELEQVSRKEGIYKSNYNFGNRLRFLVEFNCCLSKIQCKCGEKHNFKKYCRHCNEESKHLGQKHSEKTLRKMRLSAISRIRSAKGQAAPRYNERSIPLIEEVGRKFGYSFKHAENGGEYFIKELGYWVDGYDESTNTVLEIYERFHFKKGKVREKDKKRQKEIEEYLTEKRGIPCTFLKINYETQQFI